METATVSEQIDQRQALDVWIDPTCPWAWVVSRWMLEVEKVRPISPNFRILSLSILNEGKEFPEEYQRAFRAGLGIVRVMQSAAQEHGADAIPRLYGSIGQRLHNDGRSYFGKPVDAVEVAKEVVAESLAECDLPETLMDAWDDDSVDSALRESLTAAHEAAGTEVGTPVVSVPSAADPEQVCAYFGPVISRIPRGEEAGSLWDALRVIAGNPAFTEIKRGRTEGPKFD